MFIRFTLPRNSRYIMILPRISRRHGLALEEMISWPAIDAAVISVKGGEKDAQKFSARQKAILMFAAGHPLKEIHAATNISRSQLYQLLDRCLRIAPDGKPFGFRGLIHYQHQGQRKADVDILTARAPLPGSLTALFARYPSIYTDLFNYVIHGKVPGMKKKIIDPSFPDVHLMFVTLCEKSNIQSPHYPFNAESVARPALRRWVKKVRADQYLLFLRTHDPESARQATSRSTCESDINRNRFFKRVECDGHRIDLNCVIEIPSPTNEGVMYREISRLWIIVLIEVTTGAILGYSFAFGENYSAADVMRALRNSFVPWKKRQLTVTTIDYKEGGGLPSGVVPELAYACFDELHLDGAKAHLSRLFLSYIERTVGAVPVFSPAGTPNSHPYVEGFFKMLEEGGIHQSVGTTGSNTSDPRRSKRKSDLRYYMTFELLADFIDLLISRINGSPAPNSSLTKLEIIQKIVSRRTHVIRHVEEENRVKIESFDMYEVERIGLDHKRVVVRYHGAIYTNNALSTTHKFVGKMALVQANSQDLRTIECTLEDGTSLGVLYPERRWRTTAHGLVTRRAIKKVMNTGMFRSATDLPLAFRAFLQAEAVKSKKHAAMLKHVELEQLEKTALPETATAACAFNNENSKRTALQDYSVAMKMLENIGTQYRQ